MRTPIAWGEPETAYLRRFFDAVDAGITAELQAGHKLLEQSLTFLLGRLLDGKSTFQRMLEYPIDRLNADLAECGTGTQVSVEFTTNEHTKTFESSVSYADLGIVVRRDSSVFGPTYTKAIIVQSKKLYPNSNDYRVSCRYGGFDKDQYSKLRQLAKKYDWSGIVYFLYNPRLEAFDKKDQDILRALEARLLSHGGWMQCAFPFWDEKMEYYFHETMRRGYMPPMMAAGEAMPASADDIRDARAQAVSQKPGLRVLGISSVGEIVESNGSVGSSFSLQDCYQYALSSRWLGNSSSVPFLSLSTYIVNMFLGCSRGSDNESIIRIAEGQRPTDDENADDDVPGVAVRHTLVITFRSTLPEQEGAFFQQ